MYKIKDMSLFEVLQIASDEDAVEKLSWKCDGPTEWLAPNVEARRFGLGATASLNLFTVENANVSTISR